MRTWAIALIAAGCYRGNFAENVPCSADLQCPEGQVCEVTHAPPICVSSLGSGTGFPDGGMASPDSPLGACGLCDPATPVCDPDSTTCRGCHADNECASDVCSESTGACIAETNALYVRPSGDDSGTCTRAMPCATISRAIELVDDSRYAIAVHDGGYDEAIASTGKSYLVSSEADDGEARVRFAMGGGPHVLEIQGGTVVIEGIILDGGDQETLRVQGGATVTLFQSEVLDGNTGGVDVQSSTIDLEQTDVHDVGGTVAAVRIADGTATLERVVVYNSAAACLRTIGSGFFVENSFLVGCTGAGFVQQGPQATPGTFQFNTVAANATGAACATAVAIKNTIFANNGAAPQLAGCSATYSLFTDAAPQGTGNISGGNPAFVASDDDHITFQSGARNKGDPASTLTFDYDGESRPNGSGFDIGADEVH